MTQPCSVDECQQPRSGRLLCKKHLSRMRRTGRLDLRTAEDRFWSQVDKSGACWLWTGKLTADGYGRTGAKTKYLAHRASWGYAFGEAPDDRQIDHKCHTRRCVNPAHLRLVDASENRQNHRGPTVLSSTGVRSVFVNSAGNFMVRVGLRGTKHYGGTYKSLAEAEAVAVQMRNQLHTHNDWDRAA